MMNYQSIISKIDDLLLNSEVITQEEREWAIEALYDDAMDKTLNPPTNYTNKTIESSGGYLGKRTKTNGKQGIIEG